MNPEPRIMTTAEPTLEQIAALVPQMPFAAVLASHLLTTIEQADEHCHRLDALESAQRDAESCSKCGDPTHHGCECTVRLVGGPDPCAICTPLDEALVERAETAERERDEAIADWNQLATNGAAQVLAIEAERDALREALRKIVEIDGDDLRIKCTFGGGLKESKAIAAAALASATPAEGGAG